VPQKAKVINEKVLEPYDAYQPSEGDIHGIAMKQLDSIQSQDKQDEFNPYAG
jgi:hypothetical protein